VNQNGESIESDFYLEVDAENEAVMDLSIERHGDELIVCQYYIQRGDLMRDPEVTFRIEADGTWTPMSYRVDPLNTYEYSTEGVPIGDMLDMWAENLRMQGLVDE
jgi:hypothetical protein